MSDWEKAIDALAQRWRDMSTEDFAEWAFLVLGILARHAPDVAEFVQQQADRALDLRSGVSL